MEKRAKKIKRRDNMKTRRKRQGNYPERWKVFGRTKKRMIFSNLLVWYDYGSTARSKWSSGEGCIENLRFPWGAFSPLYAVNVMVDVIWYQRRGKRKRWIALRTPRCFLNSVFFVSDTNWLIKARDPVRLFLHICAGIYRFIYIS